MHIERLAHQPIIRPHMDNRMGDNINGPSLIRVPGWIARPLGRYYLYFAHHDGRYIRLAYSDELPGPWTTYRDGVLPLPAAALAAVGATAAPLTAVWLLSSRVRDFDYSLARVRDVGAVFESVGKHP